MTSRMMMPNELFLLVMYVAHMSCARCRCIQSAWIPSGMVVCEYCGWDGS